jgi:hypothetical protein
MKSDFTQAARIIAPRNTMTVGPTAFRTSFVRDPDAKETPLFIFIIDADTVRAAWISVR